MDAMRDVISIVHCFKKAALFGGLIRDYVINGEEPRDLDVIMPTNIDSLIFIRFLSNKYHVLRLDTKEIYNFGSGSCLKHKVRVFANRGPIKAHFDVDIVVQDRKQLEKNSYDFSCNLFVFSRSSLELIQVPVSMAEQPSPFVLLQEQIRNKIFTHAGDCTPGRLGDKNGLNASRYVKRLIVRGEALVKRGWRMKPVAGSFEINRHSEVLKRPNRKVGIESVNLRTQNECSVCQEKFEKDDMCVVTCCGHVFKTECMITWLEQGRSSTSCPLCRSKVLFFRKTAPCPPPTATAAAPAAPAQAEQPGSSIDLDTDSDFDEDYEEDDDEDDGSGYDSDEELLALVDEIDGLPIEVSEQRTRRAGDRPVSFTISMN
jgi:hypothetical protein